MAVLGLTNMLAEVSAPTGLWASIINWLEGGIGNYAVVIIVLTLMIKLVLMPLDFYNKYITKRNNKKMAQMQPELNKINKRYANNKQLLNQKTMELYKREHFSVYGTCFGMLIYMGITLTIFMTLFSSLGKMSNFKIQEEFKTLNTTYNTVYTDTYNNYTGDEANKEEYCISVAEEAVVEKYGEIKTSFLWIKNIWRPDNWSHVVMDYENYVSQTNTSEEELTKETYNKVMDPIREEYNGWNGYLILAVLTGLTSWLTTYLSTLVSKYRAKRKGLVYVKGVDANKSMTFVMPIIMAIFTLFYTASFGLYILAGGVFTMITSPLIALISDVIDEKAEAKKKDKNKVSYSR